MAIVVEKFETRETTETATGQGRSIELAYWITGTDDDLDAKQSLRESSPGSYDDLPRQSWSIKVIAPNWWEGTVRYAPQDFSGPQQNEPVFQFDTGGATEHITQNIHTTALYSADGAAGSVNGSDPINATPDGVQGVDIVVPKFDFSVTRYWTPGRVNAAYIRTLYDLTGKVNSGGWSVRVDSGVTLIFQPGEALFLGASGGKRGTGSEQYEIAYKFSASRNRTGLSVGAITGITKKGWEYLSVEYEDKEIDSLKAMRKTPRFAIVHQVYETADFNPLGLS